MCPVLGKVELVWEDGQKTRRECNESWKKGKKEKKEKRKKGKKVSLPFFTDLAPDFSKCNSLPIFFFEKSASASASASA
jgi:hypothetical protein